ncbi:MAG: sulfatase-like hydrolase/transferase [Thermoanaerobaculales bacterium]
MKASLSRLFRPAPALVVLVALVVWSGGCSRLRSTTPAENFNLLLVTLDTVRADHLGVYGCREAQTPNLDRLASEGVRFRDAESPVPLTLPAHACILSGLLPLHHGLHQNGFGRFPETVATLATRLSTAGYGTAAFIGAFVLDRRFGLSRGFDLYDDDVRRDPNGPPALEAERPAREVVDRAVAWLATAGDRPFFAWVHLYDAHAPYNPPEPFHTRFADRLYDGEIAEDDAELGRLLGELDHRGWAKRTVVAVVGDHGEALGEHGELTHGLLIYEASLHVPVLLRAPGFLPAGWVVDTPVSLADLAPTLAALLGRPLVTTPDRPLDGHDLSVGLRAHREPEDESIYAESRYATMFGWSPLAALRRGDLKYIAAPRPELYDLRQDPVEAHNLVTDRPKESREMAAALDSIARTVSTREASSAPDAETRAKLASLGYLAGAGLGSGASNSGKDPKDMVSLFRGFEEAHRAMAEGRVGDARQEYERLVAADPGNAVFVGQDAEACRHAGDLERAVALYRRAVELAPADRDAHYNLAMTLQDAGRRDEALAALQTAIALDPTHPEAHNALGIALSLRGQLEQARAQFAQAAELDPHNAAAFNNLANVLRDLKRPDEAERAYRRAIELAPSYADPWNGLGTLEVQRDRPADAVPDFDRALTLAPTLHEARLNRAIALDLSGKKAEASAAYRDFLTAAAGDPHFASQRDAARQLLARVERAGLGQQR